MSKLGAEVSALQLNVELANNDYNAGLALLDEHRQVVVGAQSEMAGIQAVVAKAIAGTKTMAGALAEGQETGVRAVAQTSANAKLAASLLGTADGLLGETTNDHADKALEHLRIVKNEATESAAAGVQAQQETDGVISLASGIVETLGSAATMLTTLQEKLTEIHVKTTQVAQGHASTAVLQNQDAVGELDSYISELEG